ncbi:MAG: hypothetical protein ACQERZ_07485 [Fusobacteriota bacterium]
MRDKAYNYEFIIKGEISKRGFSELERFKMERLSNGNMKLSGYGMDLSKFYSVISRFRDLGIELIKIERKKEKGERL